MLVSPRAENDPAAVNVHGEAHDVDAGTLASCYLPTGTSGLHLEAEITIGTNLVSMP
jgi:hypothetical protein